MCGYTAFASERYMGILDTTHSMDWDFTGGHTIPQRLAERQSICLRFHDDIIEFRFVPYGQHILTKRRETTLTLCSNMGSNLLNFAASRSTTSARQRHTFSLCQILKMEHRFPRTSLCHVLRSYRIYKSGNEDCLDLRLCVFCM